RGYANPGTPAVETAADEAAAPFPPAPPVTPVPRAAASSSILTDVAAPQYQAAQRALEELLRALVASKSADLHLRVGHPPILRTHGVMNRQSTAPLAAGHLEVMLLAIMPERNRVEWRQPRAAHYAHALRRV